MALSLLLSHYVKRIVINDINYQLFSFWKTLLDDPDYLIRKIRSSELTVDEWKKQRSIFKNYQKYEHKKVGFAFFYLNRTNRSGILNAGVIGGLAQNSEDKIDARFNRTTLEDKILRIAEVGNRIEICNLDTLMFLKQYSFSRSERYFLYLDPPYFQKGQNLYTNYYKYDDHRQLSIQVQSGLDHPWIMTYDDVIEIADLYRDRRIERFSLHYCASAIRQGNELLIYSDKIA